MKAKMAEGSEYFTVGSIVTCKSCYNQKFEGEVVAFDPHSKMLILRSTPTNGKPNVNDIHMVNLAYASEVEMKKEATSSPPPLQPLNVQRLTTRSKHQLEEKMRLLNAMAAGVSPEGQQLFLAITKTIDEVTWNGPNIVVMNQVTISPPYKPENCKGNNDSQQAITHVRKIVEKHIKDQQVVASEQASSVPNASSVPQQQPPQA